MAKHLSYKLYEGVLKPKPPPRGSQPARFVGFALMQDAASAVEVLPHAHPTMRQRDIARGRGVIMPY